MGSSVSLIERIHVQAIEASALYRKAQADLIEILQEVEAHQVFAKRGHSSLFAYVVTELKLSKDVAYSLITVARKAREVPELKTCLRSGQMTFSNARRVVSVLTPQNKEEWIQKATELTNQQLEKEIVKIRPREATPERASYVTPDRMRLEVGLSEREMLKLRRVQDLLCQSERRPVTLEETIEVLTREFLRRRDPLEKAKRHQVRNGRGALEEVGPGFESGSQLGSDLGLGAELKPEPALESEPVLQNEVSQLVTRREAGDSRNPRSHLSGSSKARLTKRLSPVQRLNPDPRRPIPASVLHRVNLRDQRRCAFLLSDGSRCNQTRWLEVHHRVPVSEGGANSLENLITLCGSHHRFIHLDLASDGS